MNIKFNKKIFSLFIILFTLFIIIKLSYTLMFYRNSFNSNIYNNLVTIEYRSSTISYCSDVLLNDTSLTEEDIINNIIELRTNYNEVLQDIQRINSHSMYKHNSIVIDNFLFDNIPHTLSKISDFNRGKELTLTDEEKRSLSKVRDNYKILSEIINKNITNIANKNEYTSHGVPDLMSNDTWLNIVEEINFNVKY